MIIFNLYAKSPQFYKQYFAEINIEYINLLNKEA